MALDPCRAEVLPHNLQAEMKGAAAGRCASVSADLPEALFLDSLRVARLEQQQQPRPIGAQAESLGLPLQELAHQLWPHYLQPVVDGAAAITEHGKLMRGLAPRLKALEEPASAAETSAAGPRYAMGFIPKNADLI